MNIAITTDGGVGEVMASIGVVVGAAAIDIVNVTHLSI